MNVLRTTDLSREEVQRYSRHLTLPDVGPAGQRKLKAASVLLVGAGGLGSPLGLYLAAAGVGHLGIVDDDVVDETNLQRQVIHGSGAVGKLKVESAAQRIADLNPHVEVTPYPFRFGVEQALALVADYDIVVDGSDNFPTRFLVNDADAEITPQSLRAKLDSGDPIELLDVREPVEREIATLANTIEIRVDDLAEHLDELPRDKEIVAYCRTGVRSARAVQLLRDAGFVRARSLAGGINAWSETVDPTVTRY